MLKSPTTQPQPDDFIFTHLGQWSAVMHSTLNNRTARQHAAHVKRYLWQAGIHRVSEITAASIQDYTAHLAGQAGYAPSTVHNQHSAIANLCNYLISRGIMTHNPCEHVQLPKVLGPIVNYLTPDEVAQALALAEYLRIGLSVKVAIYTGLRRAELASLQWQHLHFENHILVVRGKRGKVRSLPIHDAIYPLLAAVASTCGGNGYVFPNTHNDGPMTLNRWTSRLKPLQAVMPQISGWHIFRHTFASLLAQQGVSLAKIAEWLGHSSQELTRKYYVNLAPERYDADINRLTLREGENHGHGFPV